MGGRLALLIPHMNHLAFGIHLDLNGRPTYPILEDTRLLSHLDKGVGLCLSLHHNALLVALFSSRMHHPQVCSQALPARLQ